MLEPIKFAGETFNNYRRGGVRWPRLSEQIFRVDKWSFYRGGPWCGPLKGLTDGRNIGCTCVVGKWETGVR
jgi:hypothetical protein